MQTTLELIKTPQFWVGTIIAGILVNIISHWLISKFPPKFKNLISTLSTKWKTRTAEMRQERENRITPLINNLPEQQLLISLAASKRISGVITGIVVLAVTLFTLAAVVFMLNTIENHKPTWEIVKATITVLFMSVMTLVSFQSVITEFEEASNMVQDVVEARKRKNQRVN